MQYDESYSIDVPIQSAGAVILDEQNRLLMVQETRPGRAGLWHIPSGRVEGDELPQQAAYREVKEETGYDISIKYHLGTCLGKLAHGEFILRHAWLATIIGGSAKLNAEVGAIKFFTEAEFQALYRQGAIRMHHTRVFVEAAFLTIKNYHTQG